MGEQVSLKMALRLGLIAVAAFGLALGTRGVIALTARTETVSTTTTAKVAKNEPPKDVAVELDYSSYGRMLVSGKTGRPLYASLRDGVTSQCGDFCKDLWHAATAEQPTGGEGIDQTKLSLGAGNQLAYAGRLLYEYEGDKEPGDTEGQGSGFVWFMMSPEGTMVPA
jgi:predicted lipoprotein with Yx(FWY)xxD motif